MIREEMEHLTQLSIALGIASNPTRRPRKTFRLAGQARDPHLWDTVQLSKTERRGKTEDEIQKLRFLKWKAQNTV